MSKIKLILADDELTSRNTIKNLLMNDPDYEVVADFSDGKSALEWLRKNEADILLCDMQMPEINGVELMRLVHLINEFMPVIAISGFDNFDFVRGSLINGAANYLLKHELTREKLLDSLNQVRDKYRIVPREHVTCRRTGYCIYDQRKFTAEHIRSLVENGEIEFGCSNVMSLALSPDYRLTENVIPSEYKQGIISAVIDILAQILGQEIQYLVHITPTQHMVILLSFSHVRSILYMINTLKNLTSRLQKQIIRMLDLTCTIMIGEVHNEVEKAVEEGLAMEACLEDKLYLGGNRVVSYAVNSRMQYGKGEVPEELWKQLEFELKNGVIGESETLEEFFKEMENKHYPRKKVAEICKKIIRMVCPGEEGKKLEQRIEEYEIFGEFRSEIMELFYRQKTEKTARRKEYSALVSHAIAYMEQNYASEISLESCAEAVGSSYTYLSRAFKQETGLRFVEYLNQCRLKKAQSLLIRKNCSMKEVVEKSGFRNYNYFFKVFKESEGITPSEFAAKN